MKSAVAALGEALLDALFDHLTQLLAHQIGLGALVRRQRAIELCQGFGAGGHHLAREVSLGEGELVNLDVALAGLDGGHQRLAVLLRLLLQRLNCLPRLLDDRLGLLLLGVGQVQSLSYAAAHSRSAAARLGGGGWRLGEDHSGCQRRDY
jgi:hypothetical protein